ncbi:MAG: hypothetical protein QOH93_396 [Chloroflexia bacterium]|jgi:SAM-dependent methyltransferase|nr:hypothetical protein [Chloroflexia bacterium]
MDEHTKSNLILWNNWAQIHAESEYYDLDGIRAGKSSLKPIELEELGEVSGKSLLHLQCQLGIDTLSWARLGAQVTGVDFSDKAIEIARLLSEELGIPARFVQSDIYELPNVLSGQFDIVFTSYGVLGWLPDLKRWGEVVAHFLKPGGTFYMVEYHPFQHVFVDTEDRQGLKVAHPYSSKGPMKFETHGSYADPGADFRFVVHAWHHSMSDILNALISAGLKLEFLHEFHYTVHGNMFAAMETTQEGLGRLKNYVEREAIPLMFSVRAVK